MEQGQENISLQEVFAKIKQLIQLWWSYKWGLFGLAVVMATLGVVYAHLYRSVSYTSRITFSLETKNQTINPAQLLLGASGGGGGGLFSGDNLPILLKSNRILEQALLAPGELSRDSTLFNRWIGKFRSESLQNGEISLIRADKKRESFTRKEDSLMYTVLYQIKEDIKVNDLGGGMLELAVTSKDESWTLEFSKVLLQAATDLYFDLKIGKTRQNLSIMEQRLDSVQRELNVSMYAAAAEADQSLGIYQSQSRIPLAKREIQTQLLKVLYTELLKSIELTKTEINRNEPVFQIIDEMRMPLERTSKGRILMAIVFAVVSTFLCMIYIVIKDLVLNKD